LKVRRVLCRWGKSPCRRMRFYRMRSLNIRPCQSGMGMATLLPCERRAIVLALLRIVNVIKDAM